MSTFAPRTDILPEAQRQVWPDLAEVTRQGFVLYGGTAIALRLGHRVSVDFDFFHHLPLDRQRLYETCNFLQSATVLQDQADGLTVLVPAEGAYVKVSFLAPIRFGRIGQPQFTTDKVLEVASLEDLMATKLKVILQRAEAKDYRDIAAMIQA
ncbi:MAG: nucleotidyl transferase AbiEii/AbiGii toxin family protein, partial [Asticcacaulis sp.]|nr:nucleotidyl transferase AbiEii/AbiGii toxin family protein [Asticcacaulis sp.]